MRIKFSAVMGVVAFGFINGVLASPPARTLPITILRPGLSLRASEGSGTGTRGGGTHELDERYEYLAPFHHLPDLVSESFDELDPDRFPTEASRREYQILLRKGLLSDVNESRLEFRDFCRDEGGNPQVIVFEGDLGGMRCLSADLLRGWTVDDLILPLMQHHLARVSGRAALSSDMGELFSELPKVKGVRAIEDRSATPAYRAITREYRLSDRATAKELRLGANWKCAEVRRDSLSAVPTPMQRIIGEVRVNEKGQLLFRVAQGLMKCI